MITHTVANVNEFDIETIVHYNISWRITNYKCNKCNTVTKHLNTMTKEEIKHYSVCCTNCNYINEQEEITKEVINFRRLINSQWHKIQQDKPNTLTKYEKMIENITKLDEMFWRL